MLVTLLFSYVLHPFEARTTLGGLDARLGGAKDVPPGALCAYRLLDSTLGQEAPGGEPLLVPRHDLRVQSRAFRVDAVLQSALGGLEVVEIPCERLRRRGFPRGVVEMCQVPLIISYSDRI